MKFFVIIATFLGIAVIAYMGRQKFGSLPNGKRLACIRKSPNFKNGKFQNFQPITSGGPGDVLKSLVEFIKKQKKEEPSIPYVKTDLLNIDENEDILVWFGHSSYLIQLEGKRLIVDPIFSEISSPFFSIPKAFPGSNVYGPMDLPEVDYLVVTHDHWDHLDCETVKKIKFKNAICPLGVGAHLEHFGIAGEIISEMDWNDWIVIGKNFKIHCLTARHFSGRGLLRNKTLWASFLVEAGEFKIFIGGDGGYGSHFAEIGSRFGGVDLAILENGQYNENWRQIHMYPEETVMAAVDLKAKVLLPVHMAKISLSTHPWNEPLEKITEFSNGKNFKLFTPIIGQKVQLKDLNQSFQRWWTQIPRT
jgi:L-ascorbate metabolism protein UlaG (beta-lactamase superfamily)